MRHNIDQVKLGPRADAISQAVQNCVHCGLCLATCPTYRLLGEEMDSPRGRIYLMKNVLENAITAQEIQQYVDRCLGCQACVTACPSGVEYGDLLAGYRTHVAPERSRSLVETIAHRLICTTLPYPQRFRWAARAGRMVKPLRRVLPNKLSAMLGLLPGKLPPADPLPDIVAAKGQQRARVALLVGCVQEALAPNITRAAVCVLVENGVEVVIPPNQGCCGAIMLHVGEDRLAQKMAHQNLSAFPHDVDAILTTAAGCGSGIHEYDLLFAGLPEQARATDFAARVQDVSVFLDELEIIPPPSLSKPREVAYQDACHLLHAQGIQDAPRRLLERIPNLTLRELADAGTCCGSAGTYNLEQPQLARQLGEQKAETIRRAGVDMVVSGNIGCITQIKTMLNQGAATTPVLHIMELLDIAYRGLDIGIGE